MDRKMRNQLNEVKLNAELRKRNIPKEYVFGICERDDAWNLALYRQEGCFGERVAQIYYTTTTNETDYRHTETAIKTTIQAIQIGVFDEYKPFSIFEDNLAPTECMNILYEIIHRKEV